MQVLGYVLLLLAVPFVYQSSTNYVANEMVRDKETKMRETLKIMGLRPWIYSLSFLVQQGLWLIFPCLALTISMVVLMSEILDGGAAAALFFCFWLYSLGMLTLTMVLSNFFTNSKLVNMVLNVICFIPSGIAMAAIIPPGTTGTPNDWIQYLFWLPNFPWTVIAIDYLKAGQVSFFEVDTAIAWVCLALQTPFWFMVHLYLENIMPDNYGISKSCCFCFRSCGKSETTEESNANELPDLEANMNQEGKN